MVKGIGMLGFKERFLKKTKKLNRKDYLGRRKLGKRKKREKIRRIFSLSLPGLILSLSIQVLKCLLRVI